MIYQTIINDPSREKLAEKCILRNSYFHHSEPTNDLCSVKASPPVHCNITFPFSIYIQYFFIFQYLHLVFIVPLHQVILVSCPASSFTWRGSCVRLPHHPAHPSTTQLGIDTFATLQTWRNTMTSCANIFIYFIFYFILYT